MRARSRARTGQIRSIHVLTPQGRAQARQSVVVGYPVVRRFPRHSDHEEARISHARWLHGRCSRRFCRGERRSVGARPQPSRLPAKPTSGPLRALGRQRGRNQRASSDLELLNGAWEHTSSPDYRRVAYRKQRAIYVMRPDGMRKRRIIGPGIPSDVDARLAEPAWSPDGSALAFVAACGKTLSETTWGIYIASINGGTPRALVPCGRRTDGHLPDWSTTNWIAYRRLSSPSDSELETGIWAMRPDGSQNHLVLTQTRTVGSPGRPTASSWPTTVLAAPSGLSMPTAQTTECGSRAAQTLTGPPPVRSFVTALSTAYPVPSRSAPTGRGFVCCTPVAPERAKEATSG